jgi:hypothetical protein
MLLQTVHLRAALGQEEPKKIVAANQAAFLRAAEKAQAKEPSPTKYGKKSTVRRRKAAAQRDQKTDPRSKDKERLKKKGKPTQQPQRKEEDEDFSEDDLISRCRDSLSIL